MTRGDETSSAYAAIARGVISFLSVGKIPSPLPGEEEDSFTARAVVPGLRLLASRGSYPGLLVGGHHAGVIRRVQFLDALFYPDAVLMDRETRLMAIEVKFVGDKDRSGLIAKAVGQGLIYGRAFPWAAVLVIDQAASPRSPLPDSNPRAGNLTVIRRSATAGPLRAGWVGAL